MDPIRARTCDLSRYDVVSETLKRTPDPAVTSWLARFDVELALSTVAIAEVAYGIEKIPPDQRSRRLERGLAELRRHFADRIFPFTEQPRSSTAS